MIMQHTLLYSLIALFTVSFSTFAPVTTFITTTTTTITPTTTNNIGKKRGTRLYFFQNKSTNIQDSNDNSNAPLTQSDAQKYIKIVSSTLQKDSKTISELGKLTKVNNILGYGSPKPNTVAVRFNASFQKSGKGLSAKPLPFGLGQSNEKEGRGVMVGQVCG